MTIGGGIALIILGAILAFAVEIEIAGVNLDAVGLILMAGGFVGLLFGLVLWRRARTAVVTRPAAEERVVDHEV